MDMDIQNSEEDLDVQCCVLSALHKVLKTLYPREDVTLTLRQLVFRSLRSLILASQIPTLTSVSERPLPYQPSPSHFPEMDI